MAVRIQERDQIKDDLMLSSHGDVLCMRTSWQPNTSCHELTCQALVYHSGQCQLKCVPWTTLNNLQSRLSYSFLLTSKEDQSMKKTSFENTRQIEKMREPAKKDRALHPLNTPTLPCGCCRYLFRSNIELISHRRKCQWTHKYLARSSNDDEWHISITSSFLNSFKIF